MGHADLHQLRQSMRWLSRMRSWSWPTIELYTAGGRSDIKALTLDELERLQGIAAANPWSAVGRPAWLREHRDRIRELMLRAFVPEHASVYRCFVTAILDDGSGGEFTLDVALEDFDRLPDISLKRLVELAHGRLLLYPDIKLDPDQEQTWAAFDDSEGGSGPREKLPRSP